VSKNRDIDEAMGKTQNSLDISVVDDLARVTIELKNRRGLHARASAKFCACASAWNATIKVLKDGYSAGGGSIMGLLTLSAGVGEEITIEATGPQAREALETLCKLINDRFGEEN